MSEHKGSTPLFAIFALSLYTLVLLPYTIYRFCSEAEDTVVQPYLQEKKKKKSAVSRFLKRFVTKGNLVLLLLWVIWGALLWYVQLSSKDFKPFDPFEILKIDRGASVPEIKKAYYKLSLIWHPDKNPDPKAHKYFIEITKAYRALTDDVSRANYEKYGNPDGPQAMEYGIGLPPIIFTKDSKLAPLMLLALVGCGIMLPLVGVSWYMLSSNRYSGPNGVMQETILHYMYSKSSVKESQSLVRIPETLVCAMEFIVLPTPAEHSAPMEELRKMVLRANPDLKDKNTFWKRRASVLKVHMLLLAFLERESDSIPAQLQADLRFVLGKSPLLLDEMMKIAILPRPPNGYGWLTPAVAIVEMMQCLAQAVSLGARKPGTGIGSKVTDAITPLLQLPHFDGDVLKKLKKRRIQTLKDLQDLSAEERQEALRGCNVSDEAIEQVATFLDTMPTVACRAVCEVEGEEEIMEGDTVRCRARLLLTRPSHSAPEFEFGGKGKAVRAFTPNNPVPKDENWHIVLADPSNNAVMSWVKVSLSEAEAAGFARPELVEEFERVAADDRAAADEAGAAKDAARVKTIATATKFISRYNNGGRSGGKDDDREAGQGQSVDLAFLAPKSGMHELQLLIMSDSYIGCDKVLPLRIKVVPLTRAAAEGRDARSQAKIKAWQASDDEGDSDDDGRDRRGSDAGSQADGSGSGSSDEDDMNSGEYDSEESGELETGSEDDEDGEEADGKANGKDEDEDGSGDEGSDEDGGTKQGKAMVGLASKKDN